MLEDFERVKTLGTNVGVEPIADEDKSSLENFLNGLSVDILGSYDLPEVLDYVCDITVENTDGF